MPAPPAYLDERIDRPVVEGLRQRGFDVLTALEAALLLDWLGTLNAYRSRLFQWNDLQQLLLAGFRLPGYTEEEIDDAVGRHRAL
jgi:hypothetical protein